MILTENLTRTCDDKLALREKGSRLVQNRAVSERAWLTFWLAAFPRPRMRFIIEQLT